MKNNLIFLIISLALSLAVHAQNEEEEVQLNSNLELTAGFVPKSEYNALKANIGVNNIVFERFGAYISFEEGMDSDYSMNILGITGSINEHFYLWGGMDLFTSRGLFKQTKGVRSEFGVGILPYKWTVVRLGWSSSVGTTIAAGVKINL